MFYADVMISLILFDFGRVVYIRPVKNKFNNKWLNWNLHMTSGLAKNRCVTETIEYLTHYSPVLLIYTPWKYQKT